MAVRKIANSSDPPGDAAPAGLYDRDFYSWAMEQAQLVRERRFSALDIDNIVEELESLGRSEASALWSAYRLLLMHLLKWRYQPARRSRSWRTTIVRERTNAGKVLRENPGLKPRVPELYAEAYEAARKEAAAETGLALTRFPPECPFTVEQALDDEFWPSGGK